jgi:3D (Asp-Asp-Asp) domain-containing protein
MKNLVPLLLIFNLILSGCGGSSRPDSTQVTQKKYTPLTLEESKKLITPTIYAIPVFELETMSCSDQTSMKDVRGKLLFSVCPEVIKSCSLEGTCQIRQNGLDTLINVDSVVEGERRFASMKDSSCIYGKGPRRDQVKGYKTMCLDPYYSVAADLKIYNLGTVIFIPSVVGTVLPDGSTHNGYFIVRDSGGSINGYGRFDFFSGFNFTRESNNPLRKLGFADRETNVPYFVITGNQADQILKTRNFPELNSTVLVK